MSSLTDSAATVVTAAGLVCGLVATATGRWRSGLAMALDLWTAAGLLRLSGAPDTRRLLSAASIVAVRQVVARGLRSPAFRS